MSNPKKANFATIDFDHYGHLVDLGWKITISDYLFLEQVGNMQKDPDRGHWCTMSNADFCKKFKMKDSGIRTMQRKLEKMGLLEKQEGNKTGKRATALFFNPVQYPPSESDDSQKVTGTPSESDDKRELKRKLKENKHKEYEDEFLELWNLLGNHGNKASSYSKWKSLSKVDKVNALVGSERYAAWLKKKGCFKTSYQKLTQTYLNKDKKYWLDELPTLASNANNQVSKPKEKYKYFVDGRKHEHSDDKRFNMHKSAFANHIKIERS